MCYKASSVYRRVCYSLGLLVLMLNSCDLTSLGNRIGDGGLLSGKPCSAPCFWEIRPGLTAKDEAIEILRGHGALTYDQTDNTIFYGGAIALDYDSNNIVDRVGFMPSAAMSVDQLIEKYGNPDAVGVSYDSSSPEHNRVDAGLYYDSLHISIVLLEMHDTWPPVYRVRPNSRITYITYFTETYYRTWKASDSALLSGWKGYGPYESKP